MRLIVTSKDQEDFFLDVLEMMESRLFTWKQVAAKYGCSQTLVTNHFKVASRRFKMRKRIDTMLGVRVSKIEDHTSEYSRLFSRTRQNA